MSYKGEQQVVDDKRKREQRSRLAREEDERLARLRAEREEVEAKLRAAAEYDKHERPFNDEVAARLAEYQNTKNN